LWQCDILDCCYSVTVKCLYTNDRNEHGRMGRELLGLYDWEDMSQVEAELDYDWVGYWKCSTVVLLLSLSSSDVLTDHSFVSERPSSTKVAVYVWVAQCPTANRNSNRVIEPELYLPVSFWMCLSFVTYVFTLWRRISVNYSSLLCWPTRHQLVA
jgi:hypothetical protein